MEFFKCLTQLDGCRLNFLILQRVIREMTNLLQPTGADNHFQQIRIGIKACVLMIPLLGVTWLFGLLLPVHKAFAYIFTILNSIQKLMIPKSSLCYRVF
nr:adhesion G-protein coupled receptor D2-like isoform X3 [Pocillopora verrucosa]